MNGEISTNSNMGGAFETGLPPGIYTDLLTGNEASVNEEGIVKFCLTPEEDKNIFALTLSTRVGDFIELDDIPEDCDTTDEAENDRTDCTCPERQRIDCGGPGTKQSDCEALGCLWCPLNEGSRGPWCFIPGDDYIPPTVDPDAPTPSPSTCPLVTEKTECGYYGIDKKECESKGCCWLE